MKKWLTEPLFEADGGGAGGGEPEGAKTYTEEEVAGIRAEAAKTAKAQAEQDAAAAAEEKAKLEQLPEDKKQQAEYAKLKADLDASKARLHEHELTALRAAEAGKAGLDAAYAEFLTGADETQIAAGAKKLAELIRASNAAAVKAGMAETGYTPKASQGGGSAGSAGAFLSAVREAQAKR